jgi:hypothetical protein
MGKKITMQIFLRTSIFVINNVDQLFRMKINTFKKNTAFKQPNLMQSKLQNKFGFVAWSELQTSDIPLID